MSLKHFPIGLAITQAKQYDHKLFCHPSCLNMSLVCLSSKVISALMFSFSPAGSGVADSWPGFILDKTSLLLFYKLIYGLLLFCHKSIKHVINISLLFLEYLFLISQNRFGRQYKDHRSLVLLSHLLYNVTCAHTYTPAFA